ncbi:MAG: CaiB/BaiF CoA-transferase family protein [Acetobacteraceae bacterium]|jgi:crotonobetainyl-CoA:carnitine CoA-transferase CaiB-like acyl-CoA transferase
MRPLEGMRVVALEHAVAAPLCSRHLADLGADVIKIERPGSGDFARDYDNYVNGICSHFIWLNRGKRSVTLDVKTDSGREILMRLLAGADVLLQNLAPGAAARLGVGYEALKPAHPKLVVCDISGYGESGPMVRKKAYDLLIQAESGLISVTGSPEEPSRVGISIADIATGMYALTGITAALLRRARTGEGANVKVAMIDALGEWMTYPMLRHAYAGTPPPRSPTRHPAIAPYGSHRTKDGSIIFGLQNEREWVTFCTDVLRRPDVATDPRFATPHARRENRDELTALIENFFSFLTSAEVADLLERHGIANGRLNDPLATWNHEQFSARDKWREIQTENGPVRALLPPFEFGDFEAVMGDVPSIGQHTDQVLGELGYSASEIAALHLSGAV